MPRGTPSDQQRPLKTPEEAFWYILRAVRNSRSMSQEALAFDGGYHRTYIDQLERGEKSPSLRTVFNLAMACRVITQGAWMQMKQPVWEGMPVLDVRTLSPKQVNMLASVYDSLSNNELQALSNLKSDSVRGEIDQSLCKVLSIPDVRFIRELLDREPGLNARDIAPRAEQGPNELDNEDLEEMSGASLF